LNELPEKMRTAVRNGTRFVVLVHLDMQTVEAPRPRGQSEVHRDPERVSLHSELPRFEPALAPVLEG